MSEDHSDSDIQAYINQLSKKTLSLQHADDYYSDSISPPSHISSLDISSSKETVKKKPSVSAKNQVIGKSTIKKLEEKYLGNKNKSNGNKVHKKKVSIASIDFENDTKILDDTKSVHGAKRKSDAVLKKSEAKIVSVLSRQASQISNCSFTNDLSNLDQILSANDLVLYSVNGILASSSSPNKQSGNITVHKSLFNSYRDESICTDEEKHQSKFSLCNKKSEDEISDEDSIIVPDELKSRRKSSTSSLLLQREGIFYSSSISTDKFRSKKGLAGQTRIKFSKYNSDDDKNSPRNASDTISESIAEEIIGGDGDKTNPGKTNEDLTIGDKNKNESIKINEDQMGNKFKESHKSIGDDNQSEIKVRGSNNNEQFDDKTEKKNKSKGNIKNLNNQRENESRDERERESRTDDQWENKERSKKKEKSSEYQLKVKKRGNRKSKSSKGGKEHNSKISHNVRRKVGNPKQNAESTDTSSESEALSSYSSSSISSSSLSLLVTRKSTIKKPCKCKKRRRKRRKETQLAELLMKILVKNLPSLYHLLVQKESPQFTPDPFIHLRTYPLGNEEQELKLSQLSKTCIDDAMRQTIDLTRQFLDSHQKLYDVYFKTLSSNYQYTSLKKDKNTTNQPQL